jgi:uncharacterized protein
MANRIRKLAQTLKQIGEIEITETDFVELMQTDIRDLEIARSLRKLGNSKVMEWDFHDVLPAVNKIVNQEVDVAGFLRRTANYKVMEWDFRKVLPSPALPAPIWRCRLNEEEKQALMLRLKDFLEHVVINLIDDPGHALIKTREIAPGVLRFKLVMTRRDVAMLIGKDGHTAGAIRRILKDAAVAQGAQALLKIHSHEEEAAMAPESEGTD